MNKYLIIAMDMADLAAGIVFKRIVFSMKKYAECDIVCPNMDDESIRTVKVISCHPYKRLPYRIDNGYYLKKGYHLSEMIWSHRTFYKIRKEVTQGKYDAILSFVYASNLSPLFLGRNLSAKAKLPWVIYSVDAIPAPVAWSSDLKLRDLVYKKLKQYYPKADAIFAANPIMLEYEKDTFKGFDGHTGIVLTPCDNNKTNVSIIQHHNPICFLYAGCLYGIRNADALLKGFERFLEHIPDAKLVFVGKNDDSCFFGFEKLFLLDAIERHPFTKNINDYYDQADVLIDLNADIENDVFLSSKVCNYLSYNKPILAISQNGSPVRAMMSGIETIIHCHHDAQEICDGMLDAVKKIGASIADREGLQHQFMPEVVAKGFCDELNSLLKN